MAWSQQSFTYSGFNAVPNQPGMQLAGNNTMPQGVPQMDAYNVMSMPAGNFGQMNPQQLQMQQMQQQMLQQQQFHQQQQQQLGNNQLMMNRQMGGMFPQQGMNMNSQQPQHQLQPQQQNLQHRRQPHQLQPQQQQPQQQQNQVQPQQQFSASWPPVDGVPNQFGHGMSVESSGMMRQTQSNITNDPMQIDTDDSPSSKAAGSSGPQVINYNHQNRPGEGDRKESLDKTHKAAEDVTPQRPQGHGWPRDQVTQFREKAKGYRGYEKLTPNKTKAILDSIKGKAEEKRKAADKTISEDSANCNKCPICNLMVPMDKWVAHATSHGADTADSRSQSNRPHNDIEVEADESLTSNKSLVDYFFLPDILKKGYDDFDVLKEFSCQFCKMSGLFFDEILRHIQEAGHMHAIYRWMVLPRSPGHQRYKEHVPDVPIKNRHLKFHFCEVCLKLAGWHAADVEKHVASKAHLNKVKKLKENLEWVQRSHKMKNENATKASKWRDAPKPGEHINEGKSKRSSRSQKHMQQKEQRQQNNEAISDRQQQLFGQANQAIMSKMYGGGNNDRIQNQQPMNPQFNQMPMNDNMMMGGGNNQGGMGMIDPMVNMNNMGNNMGAPTGAMNIGSFNQGGMGMADRMQQNPFNNMSRPSDGDGGNSFRGMPNHRNSNLAQPVTSPRTIISKQWSQDITTTNTVQDSRGGPAVSNRDKLKEIVSSIRSTSNNEAPKPIAQSQANRSTAAILATLRSDGGRKISRERSPGGYGRSRSPGRYRRSRSPGFGISRRRSPGMRRSPSPRVFPRRISDDAGIRDRSPGYLRGRSPGFYRDRSPAYRGRSPEYTRARSPLYPRAHSPLYRRDRSPGYMRVRSKSPGYLDRRSPSPSRSYDRLRSSQYRRLPSPRPYSPTLVRSPTRGSPVRRYSPLPLSNQGRYSPTRLPIILPRQESLPSREVAPVRLPSPRREAVDQFLQAKKHVSPNRLSREHSMSARSESHSTPQDNMVSRSESTQHRQSAAKALGEDSNKPPVTTASSKQNIDLQKPASEVTRKEVNVATIESSAKTEQKKKMRRLNPRVLDTEAREELTKKIEATWQKYYHKYYSCVTTNPEIVLEMQKEYLRSYKGFFQEDPYFEYYYVKVAKPEDLREALTLRIDRGSPGPDPTAVNSSPSLKNERSGDRRRSKSPRRHHRRSRSPRRRTQHRRSRSPRRKSPRRRTRSPRRRSRSPKGGKHSSGRKTPHKQSVTKKSQTKPTFLASNRKPADGNSTEQENVEEIASRLLDAAKNYGTAAVGKPNTGNNLSPPQKSSTLLPPPKKKWIPISSQSLDLPPPKAMQSTTQLGVSTAHAQGDDDFNDMNHIIILSETETDEQEIKKGAYISSSHVQVTPRRIETSKPKPRPTSADFFTLSKKVGGIFPETSSQSNTEMPQKEDRFQEHSSTTAKEDRFKDKGIPTDQQQHTNYDNDPVITSTTQGTPTERRKVEAKQSGSILERLGPQRKPSTTSSSSRDRDRQRSSDSSTTRNPRHGNERKTRTTSRSGRSSSSSRQESGSSRHGTKSEDALTEMFADPFLGFVHKTLTGIILIGQYQKALATSGNPKDILSKIDTEQSEMHRRMVTEDGHLLIQLARCCVEDPKLIERKFPKVSKDIGPILRNLDKQVTTLIADTPIITENVPTPKYSA